MRKILEVCFSIDGAPYKALFLSKSEALDFLEANRTEDPHACILWKRWLYLSQVRYGSGYERPYVAEILASALFPDRHFVMQRDCISALASIGIKI